MLNRSAGRNCSTSTSDVWPTPGRRISLGEDEFFEILGQRDPSLPAILKAFLTRTDALNVYSEIWGGLSLKQAAPEGQPLNLGTIYKDGTVDTSASTWRDRKSLGQIYLDSLAARIGGRVIPSTNGEEYFLRTATSKRPRLSDLLPLNEDAWLDAMQQYIRDNFAASEA